jgi:hypothetical protein
VAAPGSAAQQRVVLGAQVCNKMSTPELLIMKETPACEWRPG